MSSTILFKKSGKACIVRQRDAFGSTGVELLKLILRDGPDVVESVLVAGGIWEDLSASKELLEDSLPAIDGYGHVAADYGRGVYRASKKASPKYGKACSVTDKDLTGTEFDVHPDGLIELFELRDSGNGVDRVRLGDVHAFAEWEPFSRLVSFGDLRAVVFESKIAGQLDYQLANEALPVHHPNWLSTLKALNQCSDFESITAIRRAIESTFPEAADDPELSMMFELIDEGVPLDDVFV